MTAVIVVLLTTATLVAAVPPTVTLVAPVKPVPVIVSCVPPPVGPELGLTAVTAGVFDRVNALTWPSMLPLVKPTCHVPAFAAARAGHELFS